MMKNLNPANINFLWASLAVEELVRSGVDYFCIAPGSRSSPLAIAAASRADAKSFIHFDERGLGFHALGYTAATRKPSVIITTSGTAVANLLPAVVEASKKKLPLIILTADRPPELRKTGANQTIDQPGIFGSYVRWNFDMPCPCLEMAPQTVLTTIDQAVYQSKLNPGMPVHINWMFREPLTPQKQGGPFTAYLRPLRSWMTGGDPFTQYCAPGKTLSPENRETALAALGKLASGIIAVGKLQSAQEAEEVLRLSEKLHWPIFPDVTSGLRLGNMHQNVIHYFDHILLSDAFMGKFTFDGILHLGGRMTSKRFYQFTEKLAPAPYITVLNHPLRNDPQHQVTLRIDVPVAEFCRQISASVPQRKDNSVCYHLQSASHSIKEALDTHISSQQEITEPFVARAVSKYIPEGQGLFLGNSMPIRDMDMYAAEHKNAVTVAANRGASGIDGNIATAAGFAKGSDRPMTVVIGDLALLHDLNSLAMLKDLKRPFVIVAVNNDGGGIFSFLPIAEFPEFTEKLFAAPHGSSFRDAARMFGLAYAAPATPQEFTTAYKAAVAKKGATVIEVRTDRQKNLAFHRTLQKTAVTRLKDLARQSRLGKAKGL